jgi:eukaryotic-like serine/threonine-protein kinase
MTLQPWESAHKIEARRAAVFGRPWAFHGFSLGRVDIHMALSPGARLGPYEVLSLVGAGGMGEVYQARDTRLDRTVAIKLLPADVLERPDRRARFETEARAISSLSHPNVCTLFDVGEDDSRPFLVMEYIEGETLDDRLTRGALPAADVLRYGAQIADALAHAHDARIVHRDLKPSNVMVTPSGAKVLDFGLARQSSAETGGVAGSTVSFQQRPLTAEGTILGTFQYMAPEQLEGKETDPRTDIFAFGMLLFEMATGRKAFEGKSQASLIASILTSRPPAISSLRSGSGDGMLPASLDHIVERCLAKNPDERWQTARDLRLELEWIARHDSRAIAPQRLNQRRYQLAWLGLAVATLVVAAMALTRGRYQPRPQDVLRFTIAPPPGTVIARTPVGTRIALAPDGRKVAFVTTAAGVDRLWVQSLDSFTPVAVAEGADSTSWSPDSQSIAFFAPADGQLKRISLAGGPARVICPAGIIDAPAWHPNGTILFSQANTGIFRVPDDGGPPIQLTKLDAADKEINHVWPEWLPDGRHFLYTATSLDATGKRAPRAVYVRSIDADDRKLLTHAESRVMYAAPGYLLYIESGTLLAQRFDTERLTLGGEPVKVAEDVAYSRTIGNGGFSVSQTGLLAYYSGVTLSDLMSFDRSGRSSALGWLGQAFASSVRFSPDGAQVVVDLEEARAGASDIWTFDLSRQVPTRFTTDLANDTNPIWSPDGRRIAFSSDRGGSPDLFSKATDGFGSEAQLFTQRGPQLANDWSPDGKHIVFEDNTRETGRDLWLLPLEGDRTAKPLIRTRFDEWGARFSPDGEWVAFVSNETGSSEVYVAALRGAGERKRISTAGGIAPRWRRDGRELFYVESTSNSIVAVAVRTMPAFTASRPVVLFSIRTPSSRRRALEIPYDVSPDGQRFLINTPPEQPPRTGITLVLNWTAVMRSQRDQ